MSASLGVAYRLLVMDSALSRRQQFIWSNQPLGISPDINHWHRRIFLYPQDELIALHRSREAEARNAPIAAGIALNQLNFGYSFSGDKPEWRPVRAFDDGVRVYIEFPENIAQGEMPPLFVIGPGGAAELVNYRVSGRYMLVDRLFAEAELRIGDRKSEQRVRIRANRRRAMS